MEALNTFFAWMDALKVKHPVLWFIMLWIVLAPIINVAISALTSKEWEKFQAERPRLAAALKILKGAGIDPVGILKSFYAVLTGRPWKDPSAPPSDKK